MLHLLIAIDNRAHLLVLLLDRASLSALPLHNPNAGCYQNKEKRNHGEGPSFDPAAQVHEVVAELENPSFQGLAADERMENVRLRLQATAIRSLQLAQFMRLDFAGVGRKTLVDEQVPDFLPALAGVTAWMGICLLDWSTWHRLPKMRRIDAVAFLSTALAVLMVNAVAAVAIGCGLYAIRTVYLRSKQSTSPAAITTA